MPNVMKVYLENGQTKSFKYDSATTVSDVLNSLQQKLGFKSMDHFSLCVEHVKSIRKNKLTLLDPAESLAWVFISNILHREEEKININYCNALNRLQQDPEHTIYDACYEWHLCPKMLTTYSAKTRELLNTFTCR